MIARLSFLFAMAPETLAVVATIGCATAFVAATIGVAQYDIKKVLAYSTVSQLGFMFVAMGVGAFSAGIFHLFTHAFFKACLFLGSGSIIHALHHEQDMRRMGGLRDQMPATYWCMVIGTLALTGFPLTAGYFSKDAVIEAAAAGHNPFAGYAFVLTVVAALLTSFYSWRLIFMTFHGAPADKEAHRHAHEGSWTILVPLIFLAAGSILAGLPFKELFAGDHVAEFFRESLKFGPDNHILHDMHALHWSIPWIPTVMMALGFLVAYQFYIRRPDLPKSLAAQHDMLYRFLLNKWYFDEIYDFLFVRPALWLGRVLWKGGDGAVIDGLGPDGVSARVLDVTRNVVRLQTGYLYHYAFAMLIGIAALITWFMFSGGAH
jgi:NADH-quinone oxidoreductase subunit L